MTLRELQHMARGKQREAWNHTADLMAHLRNLQRGSKSDPLWLREDFHPFSPPQGKKGPPVRISSPRELARMEGCPVD